MTDLAELYARDPLLHSQQDIEAIIKANRDMRYKFNLGDLRAGSVKAKTPKALEGVKTEDLKGLLEQPLKI